MVVVAAAPVGEATKPVPDIVAGLSISVVVAVAELSDSWAELREALAADRDEDSDVTGEE